MGWLAKSHGVGGNRKCYQQSTKSDQKSIETVFSIAICRQCGDKWQLKLCFYRFLSMFFDSIGVFRLLPTRCVSGNQKLLVLCLFWNFGSFGIYCHLHFDYNLLSHPLGYFWQYGMGLIRFTRKLMKLAFSM